ncbi:uncharacterized protein APUU_20195A [Aspergillus puulaauensis]|uniref:Uncharacterized protein n=1 Tax=Aspergillus puulaauensis TaxID=1220207 RepID=A0A7R8AJS0_9EURO|nr:uncharacterized protein APUU_20195A [Aspergillus puulaauensis]BCS19763.1 hypothetical protein APUU_20195A [Aspergillus puulaauensis]
MSSNERARTLFAIQTTGTQAQALSPEQFQDLVSAGQIHAGHSRDGRTFLSTDRVNWFQVRLIRVDEANAANTGANVNEETPMVEQPEQPEQSEQCDEADETNEFDEMDEVGTTDDSDEGEDEDEEPEGHPPVEEIQRYLEGQPFTSREDLIVRALTMYEAVDENDSGIEGAIAPGGRDRADEAIEDLLRTSPEPDAVVMEKGEWDEWERNSETKFWQRNKDTGVRASLGFR